MRGITKKRKRQALRCWYSPVLREVVIKLNAGFVEDVLIRIDDDGFDLLCTEIKAQKQRRHRQRPFGVHQARHDSGETDKTFMWGNPRWWQTFECRTNNEET